MAKLGYNERQLLPLLEDLLFKVKAGKTLLDKSGVRIAELMAVQVELDPSQPFLDFPTRGTPREYLKKELAWYLSQDESILGHVDDVEVWQRGASKDGKGLVSSNYGRLVYH